MMSKDINIGLINFTNCLPINYSFYKWNYEGIILKEGYPSLINELMYNEKIHAAPISSVEYLKNKDKYTLIDTICISSDGEAGSVILFSNYELEKLAGKTIAVPYTSASSIALLKILLNEYSDLNTVKFQVHKYETTLEEALKNQYDAILYIGDPALIANIKYKDEIFKKYDLGKCWKELTGYPMVFGTWAALSSWKSLNENKNKNDFEQVKFLLNKAVESGLNMYFNEIINLALKNLNFNLNLSNANYIKNYLTENIKYNFTENHKKGLELFETLYFKTKNI
ncbi:MAG: menaquinone biosynthesis protein [bacterium]